MNSDRFYYIPREMFVNKKVTKMKRAKNCKTESFCPQKFLPLK